MSVPLTQALGPILHSYDLTLFADYFQFYLQDESANGDLSDAWNDEAVGRLLAVAPGVVGIGTVRNSDVSVTIEILDQPPSDSLDGYDHVVECSLLIQSGHVVVAGCTDYFPDARRISLPPGTYCLRVLFTGLSSVSADGLVGDDRYRLQLWPAHDFSPRVLKQRAS